MSFNINKRYKDIFEKYIHRGEPTPFTIGTLVVFALCFLILIFATFSQFNFSHPWFEYVKGSGLHIAMKNVSYTPQIPVMLFIIYILGRNYSVLLFITYLIVGFFVWPIFAFGGGLGYIQNYLFGYFLGFIFATFLVSFILKKSLNIKNRLISSLIGVISIHLCGFLYCFILALLKVIDLGLIFPIFNVLSGKKIIYDILFSGLLFLIVPYIKNVLWVCMKPRFENLKKSRKSRHMTQNN